MCPFVFLYFKWQILLECFSFFTKKTKINILYRHTTGHFYFDSGSCVMTKNKTLNMFNSDIYRSACLQVSGCARLVSRMSVPLSLISSSVFACVCVCLCVCVCNYSYISQTLLRANCFYLILY